MSSSHMTMLGKQISVIREWLFGPAANTREAEPVQADWQVSASLAVKA